MSDRESPIPEEDEDIVEDLVPASDSVEENKKAPMFKPTDTIVLELSVPKQQSKFCGIKTFNGPVSSHYLRYLTGIIIMTRVSKRNFARRNKTALGQRIQAYYSKLTKHS